MKEEIKIDYCKGDTREFSAAVITKKKGRRNIVINTLYGKDADELYNRLMKKDQR